MENPLDTVEGLLNWCKTFQSFWIQQPYSVALTLELNEKGTLSVSVATSPFSINSYGPGAGTKFFRNVLELGLSINDWGNPTDWLFNEGRLVVTVLRLMALVDVIWRIFKTICGEMRARNRYFLRIGFSGITPSETGGKPANVHTISVQAVKCLFRLSPAGVHDARSSKSVVSLC